MIFGVLHWLHPFHFCKIFWVRCFMKISPRHNDTKMRAIYGALIVLSVAFMNIGTGIVHTVFMCLTVLCLCAGLFLFLRFELTTYSYILRENDDGFDFYVDKSTGKRGSYVCFYSLKDCVALEKLENGKKKEIQENHGKTFFYNYIHNRFSNEKYVIVFQDEKHCHGIVCQLDNQSYERLSNAISLSKRNDSSIENAKAEEEQL